MQRVHLIKVEHAYPVYSLDYRDILAEINKKVGKYENLFLAGRQGMFWYNNMDDSFGLGLEIGSKLS